MADLPDFTPLPGRAQQTQTADVPDFTPLPSAPAPHRGTKLLDNSNSDDPNGFAKNTGTGLAKMTTHVPGFVGDARELGKFLGSNLLSIVPGEQRTAKAIREGFDKNANLDADINASVHGPGSAPRRLIGKGQQAFLKAPSGEDIYREHIAPTVGEYEPETRAGRIYQAGLESALPMPGGKANVVTKAATAVPSVVRGADLGRKVLTSSPVVGGLMGATAQGVGEATDSAGAGIGTSMIIPSILRRIPARATAYDRAADKLHGNLHNPDDAMANLRDISKNGYKGEAGSPLTLAEASLDPNTAHVEKQHMTADTDFGARANDVRGKQAANREGALGGMSNGDSSAASNTARQLRDDIHAKAEADTQTQQKILDTLHGPEATDKAASGKRAFDIAKANDERAQQAVSKLYDSIDPDGKIHVDTTPLNEKAAELIASQDPKTVIPFPAAEKILEMAQAMPPSMKLVDLTKFDRTIGQARWAAKQAGQHDAADLLKKLQDHLSDIRDGSIDRHAEWEKGAVARGELKPDQTIAATLQRQRDEWLAERQRATGAAAGTGTNGAGGQGSFSPASGASSGAGAGNPAGGAGVQGNVLNPNELAEAAERLRLAKQGHGDRKTLFAEGPVGGILEADNPMMGSVPGSAFAAGPTGGEKTRAWLNAGVGDPAMVEAVKEMALTELHNLSKDGVVTPDALQKWKSRFGSALGEIDKQDPGFSARFDGHAMEQQKLLDTAAQGDAAKKTFGRTEAARLLNFEHPQEVDAHVGALMGSKAAGPQRLRTLMEQFEGHPEAQEGVRNAAVQWLVDKAQSRELVRGPDGAPVKASAPGNYLAALEDARPHLEAVFGADGYQAAEKVAAEMARTKQMIDAKIVRGGSDSVKNLVQYLNEASSSGHALSTAEGFAIWEALSEASRGVMHGDPSALARAAGLMLGRAGLHKWSELLARKRGRGIQETGDIIREALLDPEYGHALLEHGAARTKARAPSDFAQRHLQQGMVGADEVERKGHASGGAAKLDHAAHAARLVRDVPRVRKAISAGTEPMLKLSDNVITKALAIANQGLNNG